MEGWAWSNFIAALAHSARVHNLPKPARMHIKGKAREGDTPKITESLRDGTFMTILSIDFHISFVYAIFFFFFFYFGNFWSMIQIINTYLNRSIIIIILVNRHLRNRNNTAVSSYVKHHLIQQRLNVHMHSQFLLH